ncbi:ABC-type spermidine/putrescine transport system permease subunit I [Rhodoligotrophos appendicifer]|uniref:ABC transporter permease n=1 Tax=Rhodoligotrophos appendicifer TaxID=987056 RepID=UPI00117CEC22|nr:ABC transporter permease [Rhodoligotrophos appendicifer]
MSTATLDRDRPTPDQLRRVTSRERWRFLLLVLPALAPVALLLILPFGWLTWLSITDTAGQVSAENYILLAEQPATLKIFAATFRISLIVTLLCALLGYPLAYMLAMLPPRIAAVCLLAVILPFWTSILVRTYAWMVLLARRGILNEALQDSGLIDQPLRLMHNEVGTVIGMTHIMLPFLILPLYATMSSIDRAYIRAGASLGATPMRVFWKVYFPLTLPGLFGGLCFVFVLCLGFYITPALLGGGRVQMISMVIERSVTFNAGWGPAGALGLILVVMTTTVLAIAWMLGRGRRP